MIDINKTFTKVTYEILRKFINFENRYKWILYFPFILINPYITKCYFSSAKLIITSVNL